MTTETQPAPKVVSFRPAPDVKLLLEEAIELPGRSYKNWAKIANASIRAHLTPIVGNKRIRNLQEKMGVKVG